MKQREIYRRLLTYIRPYGGTVVLSFLLAIITVVLTLIIPIRIGVAVDEILGEGRVNWDVIMPVLWQIAACAGGSALASYLMNLCNNRVSFGVVKALRTDAFATIGELPVGYVDTHPHGDIVSRVIADADTVADGLLMGLTNLFSGVITILGTLIFMLITSVPIAITVVIVTPLSLLVARFIARRSYKSFTAQSQARGDQTAVIDEVFTNLNVVQSFGQEENVCRQFDETAERLQKHSLAATFFSSITNPATRFVNSIVYAAVGVFGALFAVQGSITVGLLSAFLSYANQYTKPFNEISGVVAELQNAVACAGRLLELIDAERDENKADDKVLTDTDGRVKLEHVYFSYKNDDAAAPGALSAEAGMTADENRAVEPNGIEKSHDALIGDLNLDVRPGSRVAIVGPTGAGKSTMINLLMRFYDVDRGRILVSDADIREVTRDSLRAQYGMVLQETWLMHGTVRDNIAFGKPDASEEEIIAAAKAAHAHSFIRRLPQGYDTVISDESGLSAGQRQLLCIARVMLQLPPMLILDEATSSIDTRTEVRIQKAFSQMMEGRTSFIVAHRLQTIREADIILVMRDGRIIEQGTHAELVADDTYYKQLYEASKA
ncbi:MAG: ABC transporter ATP-binding protein [Eubacterium sp.]|nr:ABC transporter ATP-binding protein [Eubacterium sp.]